jgi:hypothetical protein
LASWLSSPLFSLLLTLRPQSALVYALPVVLALACLAGQRRHHSSASEAVGGGKWRRSGDAKACAAKDRAEADDGDVTSRRSGDRCWTMSPIVAAIAVH